MKGIAGCCSYDLFRSDRLMLPVLCCRAVLRSVWLFIILSWQMSYSATNQIMLKADKDGRVFGPVVLAPGVRFELGDSIEGFIVAVDNDGGSITMVDLARDILLADLPVRPGGRISLGGSDTIIVSVVPEPQPADVAAFFLSYRQRVACLMQAQQALLRARYRNVQFILQKRSDIMSKIEIESERLDHLRYETELKLQLREKQELIRAEKDSERDDTSSEHRTDRRRSNRVNQDTKPDASRRRFEEKKAELEHLLEEIRAHREELRIRQDALIDKVDLMEGKIDQVYDPLMHGLEVEIEKISSLASEAERQIPVDMRDAVRRADEEQEYRLRAVEVETRRRAEMRDLQYFNDQEHSARQIELGRLLQAMQAKMRQRILDMRIKLLALDVEIDELKVAEPKPDTTGFTDPDGWIVMPTGRAATREDMREYFGSSGERIREWKEREAQRREDLLKKQERKKELQRLISSQEKSGEGKIAQAGDNCGRQLGRLHAEIRSAIAGGGVTGDGIIRNRYEDLMRTLPSVD